MDTKNDSAVADVPTFKIARVGNERKRKGAGFSLLRGGGPRGAWSGAAGGSGPGGLGGLIARLGLTYGKALLMIALTSGISAGAIYMGQRSGAMGPAKPKAKPKLFAQDKKPVKLEGDTSNLPSTAKTMPNSLGYVSGSVDGLTPEERAKKAAEAKRKAEEEAKKASADAAGKPDPAALLAAAQADGGKKGFANKFGQLSSGMGGGSLLSGGAGMSGGVGRQFGGGGFNKGDAGRLSAAQGGRRVSSASAARPRLAASKMKGFAKQQLDNANRLSQRGASAGKGETASYDAASAFDNNSGAGNAITGAGIGAGAGASGVGDSSPNPSGSGGSDGSGAGDGDGCTDSQYVDASGACQDITEPSKEDANKTLTLLANIATGMLLAISVMAGIALLCQGTAFLAPVASALGAAMGVMGGIIAALGVAIIAMGDYFSGTVFTLVGGLIALMAFGQLFGGLTYGVALVVPAAGALLGQAAKMLDGNTGKAGAAD